MISPPIIVAVIILLLTWLIFFYYKQNRNLPPGPWGLPVLGYYPFLPSKHYLHYAELAKRYGNVFSYRTSGGKLVVILNGVNTIKDVLINRAEEFTGRPQESNLVSWLSRGLGLAQEEGEVWKEHRRFFLHTAKSFGFAKQQSDELIQKELETLIKDLKKEEGQPCNLKFHVAHVVNSVICSLLFSKKFDKYGGNFEDIVNAASYLVERFADERYMLVGSLFEHIVMKYLPATKRIRDARKLYTEIAKEIVAEHIKTFDPDHLRDYTDSYLYQAYKFDKSGEQHTFTIDRLESITFNMLMEMTESPAGTIIGLLDLAVEHPEEQKLVQEELDSVVGRERLPSMMDRQRLPYLEAFIQELYRHNMPFNISTHYCNYKETTIEGYRIPRRTILVANLWTISNDPELYPEPAKFNPKRFIDKNGRKIKTEGPYPFGIGKRSCVAESLAHVEVFLVIAALLQNFTLYPAGQSGYVKAVPRH